MTKRMTRELVLQVYVITVLASFKSSVKQYLASLVCISYTLDINNFNSIHQWTKILKKKFICVLKWRRFKSMHS